MSEEISCSQQQAKNCQNRTFQTQYSIQLIKIQVMNYQMNMKDSNRLLRIK